MKALVIGATGATGRDLVNQLLHDPFFGEVVIFVRRPPNIHHPKLTIFEVDFNDPDAWAHLVTGDIAFSAMGTTLKVAGSKAHQWIIDYDYQYQFAQSARNHSVPTFILVSSVNANPASKIFYSRMKGALEVAISTLAFDHLIIMQPGILDRTSSDRFGEKLVTNLLYCINHLGLAIRLKPLKTADLADVMIILSQHPEQPLCKVPPQIIAHVLQQAVENNKTSR